MRRAVYALAVVAIVGAAAIPFATADAAGGSGKPPTPCKLLTRAQVEDLLGEEVQQGTPDRGPGALSCEWESPEDGTGGYEGVPLGVEVTLRTKRQALREFRELVRDQDNEIIDGVGDEAFAGEFATPVVGRVGNQIFEVDVHNYDTSNWDGDPRRIATDGAVIVGERLIRAGGRDPDDETTPEQPAGVAARFADDIPVPSSFAYRVVFGTEYDGSGAFGGELTVDEVVAFYQEALPEAGFEVGEVRSDTNIDGQPVTVVPFEGNGRTGEIEIGPNTDPPGATLIFVSYETPEE